MRYMQHIGFVCLTGLLLAGILIPGSVGEAAEEYSARACARINTQYRQEQHAVDAHRSAILRTQRRIDAEERTQSRLWSQYRKMGCRNPGALSSAQRRQCGPVAKKRRAAEARANALKRELKALQGKRARHASNLRRLSGIRDNCIATARRRERQHDPRVSAAAVGTVIELFTGPARRDSRRRAPSRRGRVCPPGMHYNPQLGRCHYN